MSFVYGGPTPLRAILVWHQQRKRAYEKEQAVGAALARSCACARHQCRGDADAVQWANPDNPHRTELTKALHQRSGCLIGWALNCRRVAVIARRLGRDPGPLLDVARSCERAAWQGGHHRRDTRTARVGRLAETVEEPHVVEPLFERKNFREAVRAAGLIVDRLAILAALPAETADGKRPSSQGSGRGAGDSDELPDPATLPPLLPSADLAQLCRVPANALDTALRRHAESHPDCRTDVPNPRRGEPRVLYRVRDVWPIVQAVRLRSD
jgi:hypothetical protein